MGEINDEFQIFKTKVVDGTALQTKLSEEELKMIFLAGVTCGAKIMAYSNKDDAFLKLQGEAEAILLEVEPFFIKKHETNDEHL